MEEQRSGQEKQGEKKQRERKKKGGVHKLQAGAILGRNRKKQTEWQGLSGCREKPGLLVKEGRKACVRGKKKSAKVLFCYVEISHEMRCKGIERRKKVWALAGT